LGAVERQQGRLAAAQASCRAALSIDATVVAASALLGELLADQGQFAEAIALFEHVLALDPDFAFAYFSIATHRKMTRDDAAWLAGVERLLAKRVPLRHEISLRYALGKYFDDVKQYDAAFDSYRQANELTKRYGALYDRPKFEQRVSHVIQRFDPVFMSESPAAGNPSPRPVFIVGMPRSGTSLSEQILASHPEVFGAGELIFWQSRLVAYLGETDQRRGDPAEIPGMARQYLERLNELSDAPRVVDKMPLNFMNLGLIHAAFPQAKIIHLRRDPIDTCLSIYFQYFNHQHRYANDLDSLAHFYGQYLRVMEHWRALLPATTLLEVPYDQLVNDQELWSRRMVEFIGLPWDPRCLDFHRTERTVITLSKWQVRQKIHTGSSGRWRHYERHVGPLLRLIDANASAAR
jgi:tetratricopeptide (TPR) repeat protein